MIKYIISACVLLSTKLVAQDYSKEVDLIIMIDNKIEPLCSVLKLKIIKQDTTNVISVEYHPGSLLFKQSDYESLISGDVSSLYLEIGNYSHGGKQTHYDCEIPYQREWLEDTYNILRIYNLDEKPYKGIYDPLSKDKNYTFELLSPSHTFLRVKRK